MIRRRTLLNEDGCRVLWDAAQHAPEGDVVEVGVYRGGSLALLALARPQSRVHGYDPFSGHPAVQREVDDGHAHPVGRFWETSVDEVGMFLRALGVDLTVTLHQESAVYPRPAPIALLHLDIALLHLDVVDLFESTRAALACFTPYLVPGGVVLVDDYTTVDCPGVRVAVDSFAARGGWTVAPAASGHARLTRTTIPEKAV